MKKVVLILVLGLILAQFTFADDSFRVVTAVKTSTPKVDGQWSDAEWNYGGVAKHFTQTEPKDGIPASENTEAYFLYDDENIYVGIKCLDSEPEKIMDELAGRDNIGASDYIEVIFDTFNDDRNGYGFGATPGGVKVDGKYFNDGEWDISWDGIWNVETGRLADGWFAEFKIPFATMSFPKVERMTWGMNVLRSIQRKREHDYWQEVTRDFGLKMSRLGNLENLSGIRPGMNLQLLPYVTSGLKQDRVTDLHRDNPNGFTGLDVRYNVTSNLTAVLTVNPDFAQIEADEDRINLSHYPLILREKRPFFLEGASIFHTAGNSMSDGEYQTALFYSRRINEPVYGLKMTGKVGNWDVGVIHALNDNDYGLNMKIEDEELPANTRTRAFYNVVRMSKDIFARSQVGFIAMSKEHEKGYNRIVGMDGRIRLKNNYTISFEGVRSFGPDTRMNNHSANLYLNHQSDFFKFSVWYQEQAPNFVGNDLGFYDYNNFRDMGLWFQLCPRFEKFGIRKMGNNVNAWTENYQNKYFFDKGTLTRGWNYNFWIQTMKYWGFGAGRSTGKNYDRVDEVLYPNLSYWVWMNNNWTSRVNFSLNHSQGKYREGYRWSYSGSLRFRPSSRFNVQFSYNRSLAKLIDDDTGLWEDNHYEIFRSKIYYHFSRNLNTRFILQYNGMEERLDTYYLIAYNFKPGSFLYLAYTERFDSDEYTNAQGFDVMPAKFGSSYKVLQLKFSYLMQI